MEKKKLKGYKLATLGKEVDLRHLPTAYSISHPLQLGLCDYYTLMRDDLDDEIGEDREEETEETECEQTDISVALAIAINDINS
ncbi:13186_t:CDS:2, partial [Funneliformis geosporum]